MAKKKPQQELEIVTIKEEKAEFCILGRTPLIQQRLSQKVRQELLAPKGRKSAAEKKGSIKHDPIEEFRASAYLSDDPTTECLLEMPSATFKAAMSNAALDIPGATKASIGRLVWVHGRRGDRVGIYGEPKLFMSPVRCSDMKRTPDIRTRCIIPEWACRLTVSCVVPILNMQTVANLLGASGMIAGVGDWRPQRGSGSYGQFEVVAEDHPDFQRIVKASSRALQEKAMEDAEPYDSETEELMAWFGPEMKRRGFEVTS